jgi:hypothetical protein
LFEFLIRPTVLESMARIVTICRLLVNKAEQKYGSIANIVTFEEDENLVDSLLLNIETVVHTPGLYSEEIELEYDSDDDFKDDDDDDDDGNDETNTETEVTHSQESSQEWENCIVDKELFTLTQIKNILNYYDSIKSQKFEKTLKRYKRVKHPSYIQRFREYLQSNGTNADKLNRVEAIVAEKFNSSRSKFLSVHALDLRRWAIQAAEQCNLQFTASRAWVETFQKRNRIVSRKVTKYITFSEQQNLSEARMAAELFVRNAKDEFIDVSSSQIFNTDQSGFNYELTTARTLSHKGEKDTSSLIRSHNATTHSYSIMPILAMNGKLRGKLLVCLQEKGGRFGPRISEKIEVPNNIYLVSSKSGKLDKSIMMEWTDNCFAPLAQQKSVLLDSWSGQKDDKLFESISTQCKRLQIPPKTTPWVQPLDRYFFRQYKIFSKRINERILMDNIPVDLKERNQLLKMHSLVFNQMQADSFTPLLKYSWFSCGYVEARAGRFRNLQEIIFDVQTNDCELCGIPAFMKCSYCETHLCFSHFFIEYHFHE